VQVLEHPYLQLLRPRVGWPRRRTTDQRYEFAAFHHSITSSAIASGDGGTQHVRGRSGTSRSCFSDLVYFLPGFVTVRLGTA
jgi:hypothetical protein